MSAKNDALPLELGEEVRRTLDCMKACATVTQCDDCPNGGNPEEECPTAAEAVAVMEKLIKLIQGNAEDYVRLKLANIRRTGFNYGVDMLKFRRESAEALRDAGFVAGKGAKAVEVPNVDSDDIEKAAIKIHQKAKAQGGWM